MKPKKTSCLKSILLSLAGLLTLCLLAVGLFALDNAFLPGHSEVTNKLSQEEKALLFMSINLRQKIGNEVLPGWGQAEIPLILYNEAFAFLVDISSAPTDGWVTVLRGEPLGSAWEVVPEDDFQGKPYYRQALPSNVDPQAFTVKVGETYAASLTTNEYFYIRMRQLIRDDLPVFLRSIFPYRIATHLLVDSSDQYVTLILHEAAHAFQGIKAPERLLAGERANYDFEQVYPWENDTLREDWQTELDLLASALKAETVEETIQLAREFLEVRQSRRLSAGLNTDLIGFERQREWVEGIGRYAELSVYRLGQANSSNLPSDPVLNDQDFHQFSNCNRRWIREIEQMKRLSNDGDETRFYYTGMAQAVLLDRLDPDWKYHLFEPGVWLEDLLAEAVSTGEAGQSLPEKIIMTSNRLPLK